MKIEVSEKWFAMTAPKKVRFDHLIAMHPSIKIECSYITRESLMLFNAKWRKVRSI